VLAGLTRGGTATDVALPSITLGSLELVPLSDGFFMLDGGAMFGVVPKPLWERVAPADGRNRIRMGMRPLLVRGERTVLIDAGCGDKMDAKAADIYGFDRSRHLDHALADAGVAAADVDVVIASHLHFDHAGGFTAREGDGLVRPRFPRAQYIARAGEWDDASRPHERNRASYFAENYVPLRDAGVLTLVDEDGEVTPGVRLRRTGGHTRHHQVVLIESGGKTAVFMADLIPTVAHVPLPWIMGYDLFPMETLEFKRAFLQEAVAREYLVFFEHDPVVSAGYLRETGGRITVERVI
jgi:glyoxylase-like metal-dependent hydrolase (beta-lactamase superfamily II)